MKTLYRGLTVSYLLNFNQKYFFQLIYHIKLMNAEGDLMRVSNPYEYVPVKLVKQLLKNLQKASISIFIEVARFKVASYTVGCTRRTNRQMDGGIFTHTDLEPYRCSQSYINSKVPLHCPPIYRTAEPQSIYNALRPPSLFIQYRRVTSPLRLFSTVG